VGVVIARYTRPQIGRVWTDERRLEAWLAVELAALDAWARLGVVPAEAVAQIRARARVDVERARAIERRTHHDVVAFTESVAEQVGPAARWFHYGLTSRRRRHPGSRCSCAGVRADPAGLGGPLEDTASGREAPPPRPAWDGRTACTPSRRASG
jgi:DNA-binding transcriptional regulator YdaS (Cro superfamily)